MPFVKMTYWCKKSGQVLTEKVEVESLGKCLTAATEECKEMLDNFNEVEVERYGDKANVRELMNVQPCKVSYADRKHIWEKVNLVTQKDSTGMYDLLRCKRCGQEHKRFGLSDPPRFGCYPKRRPRPRRKS